MIRHAHRSILGLLLLASCAEAPPPPAVAPAAPAVDVSYHDKPRPAPPEKPAAPAYWKNRSDLFKAPAPPVPAELQLPPVERWKLPNGLDVIVVARKDLPVISFQIAVKAGGYDETRDRQGVASFTASMLRKGTKKRKADDISKAIDFVGGSLHASAGMESSQASCTALSKDRRLCLDLLSDILQNPTFPEEEMPEVRDRMIAGLRGRYDDPEALASEHFSNLLFGERHPDGWVLMPDDVKKITRDELVEFWRTYYRPQNAILAIAGDVDPAALKAEIEKAFGGWESAPVPARPEFKIPEHKGTRVLLVDKPDLTQTTLVFGHKGIRHTDPEWYAVTMMNYVLGGSDFSSRLTQEVRSKQGLTYGIRSSFGQSLYEGAFEVSTSTKNESAWPALVAAVDEIRRMKAEGPTGDELAKAKGYFAGSYPFKLQSAENIAGSIVGAELHGLGIAYVKQYPLRVAHVDAAKAKLAAADWLNPDNLIVVIVGKAAEVEPQLAAAKIAFEKINFKDPISYAERRAERKAQAKAAAAGEGAKAMELVRLAIEAQGGEKAYRALKDITMVKTGSLKIRGEQADLSSTATYRMPDRVRVAQEVMTPQGTQKMEFLITPTAVKGGMGGGDLRPIPPQSPVYGMARSALFSDQTLILLNLLDAKPAPTMQVLPAVAEGGRTLDGVAFKSPTGDPVTIYFDAKTHLVARIKSKGQQGGDKVESFDDYKPVGGVLFPYKTTSNEEGIESEELVKDLKVNTGVDPKTFE